jgi:hypothetical protein
MSSADLIDVIKIAESGNNQINREIGSANL